MSTPHLLTESVRVRIEPALKIELERRAAELDRKPSAVARQAIREYLNRPAAELPREV
jgi:predicted transcriptional regulator